MTTMPKLSDNEKRTLARYYLGGVEALRTDTFKVHRNTIDSLIRKGLLTLKGFTEEGRVVAKKLADSGVI